ncbi:MAG TPA: TlpA disulfide reductase family protein [Turneriella sp.]|nr:TlpA disulfide reductase family protein [Turneriella sp.]
MDRQKIVRTFLRYTLYIIGFFILSAFANWLQAPKPSANTVVSLPLSTLDGTQKILPTAQGKTTVVYFFAPWCTVCKLSMDAMNMFEGSARVQALTIGLDYENRNELAAFQERMKAPIYAGSQELQRQFQVDRYPTVYIIDGNGKIKHTMVGYASRLGIWIRSWI